MLDGLIISVDAMGGDNAPDIVIKGIEYFLSHEGEGRRARFLLHGDAEALAPLLDAAPRTRERSEVFHTDKVVAMDDKPSQALRKGKGSSMWNTIASVKGGQAGVAISAGNTGALMAMSKLQLRAKRGVQRPAIAASWPNLAGDMTVVLDVGANVECDAAQLTEFAILGEAYFRAIFGKSDPVVGLLNVGTEEGKGNAVIKAAHERLSQSQLGLNYKGFVEGNDISAGTVDVVITDGFTGNMAIRKLKKKMDPRRANGGVFLGLNGVVVKSHGGTDAIGYANALNIAMGLAESDFQDAIDERLDALHDEDDNIGFIA